jgi:hypothetical protein
MDNINEINNDNQYLEFSNLMKEQYDELKKENINFKKELVLIKKEICSSYGLSRVIDTMSSELVNIPIVLINLIESHREFLSKIVQDFIIKSDLEDEESDDEDEIMVNLLINQD